MKTIKFFMIAAICVIIAGCQNKKDWEVPSNVQAPYGNPNIVENPAQLMTISALKTKYATEISTLNKYAVIEDDIQIKGYVTCNDRTGNMYKEVTIQDETAAISIGINYGGCFSFLPEGQEILIALKGLHIGNYRKQATIGMQYLDKKATNCVGRMPLSVWNEHYTYTSRKMTQAELDQWAGLVIDPTTGVEKALFADCKNYSGTFITTTWDFVKDQGKLGVLKNVTIHDAGYYDNDPKVETYVSGIPFVPGESALVIPGFSTSWTFNEMENDTNKKNSVALYTSSYADFAANKLPTGKFNVIGIVKRYSSNDNKDEWEFIIRDIKDIQEVN